jgi:ATP-dependent DNA ligase
MAAASACGFRTSRNWADAFPAIVEAVGRLNVESVVLDGEAVCLLEDGRPNFGALRSRQACTLFRTREKGGVKSPPGV